MASHWFRPESEAGCGIRGGEGRALDRCLEQDVPGALPVPATAPASLSYRMYSCVPPRNQAGPPQDVWT